MRKFPWKDPEPGRHELFGIEFNAVSTASWCKCGWHSDEVFGREHEQRMEEASRLWEQHRIEESRETRDL